MTTTVQSSVFPLARGGTPVGVAFGVRLRDGSIRYLTAWHVLAESMPTDHKLTIGACEAAVEWECKESDVMALSCDGLRPGSTMALAFDPATPPSGQPDLPLSHPTMIIYRDSSYTIRLKDLTVSSELVGRDSESGIHFNAAQRDELKLLAAGASGSPVLDDNDNVIGIFRRIGLTGHPFAVSIAQLSKSGLLFDVASETTPFLAKLKRIRDQGIEAVARERRLCDVLGVAMCVIVAIATIPFVLLGPVRSAAIGLPLVLPLVICVSKWRLLVERINSCERDADDLVYVYRRLGVEVLERRLLQSKCRNLRRLLLDELSKQGSQDAY